MRTRAVVGVVVGLHVVAVGSLLLVGGCGTSGGARQRGERPVVMPPVTPVQEPVAARPIRPAVPVMPVPEVAETKTYVVQKGDSLSVIAQRFKISVGDIMDLNGIKDPNRIMVGQALKLPGFVDLSAPAPAVRPRAESAAPRVSLEGAKEYVVQPGDSLSVIAQRHGIKTAELREANKLTGDLLKVGQKLVVPVKKAGGTAAVNPPAAPVVVPPPVIAPPVVAPAPVIAPVQPEAIVPPVAVPGGDAGMRPEAPNFVHVVEPGQTLADVAKMYTTTVEALVTLNGLTSQEITVGQTLKVPVNE